MGVSLEIIELRVLSEQAGRIARVYWVNRKELGGVVAEAGNCSTVYILPG